MNKYSIGQKAYIIESIWVSEVIIVSKGGSYYVIKFTDRNGAIRVRESRLFETEHKAKLYLHNKKYKEKPKLGN